LKRYTSLEQLLGCDVFAMFMALHVYLYLHTSLVADLVVDTTELSRNVSYRADIEHRLGRATDLPVRFPDGHDEPALEDGMDVDWQQIRSHARTAAETLGRAACFERLATMAEQLIEAAAEEMRLSRRAAPRGRTVECSPPPSMSGR
jgi:hypothetical protein